VSDGFAAATGAGKIGAGATARQQYQAAVLR
jgi:hypothetical protein